MKTSTKIITLYFCLLFAGILALFIVSKTMYKGYDPRSGMEQMDLVSHEKSLPDFKVVVLLDEAKCRLVVSKDYNKASWQIPGSKDVLGEPFFVRNDTLYIKKSITGNTWDLNITSKSLQTLIIQPGGCVRLVEPVHTNLDVVVNQGEFFLESTSNSEQAELLRHTFNLNLKAKSKSYVELNSWFNHLNAQMDSSNLQSNTSCMIQQVQLNLVNFAKATIQQSPNEIVAKRDSTSYLRIY